jgi:hypothetical protein
LKPYIPVIAPKFIDFLEYFSPLGKGGDGKPGIANITLAPFILSWEPMSEATETHEGIHVVQQYECGVFGALVACPILMGLGAKWWTILAVGIGGFLPFIGWFYWAYLLTWAYWTIVVKHTVPLEDPIFDNMKNGQKGYYLIPFEREAYLYDQDGLAYFKERSMFAWTHISDDEALKKGSERSERLYLAYKGGHLLGNVVTKA